MSSPPRTSKSPRLTAAIQICLLWGGSLAGAGLAFLTQVVLGRHMGPGDYGIFSNALAQCMLLSQVAGLGLQTFWLSVYGREGRHGARWIPGSLKLLAASSTLAALTLFLIAALGPGSHRTAETLALMAPSILGFAAVELVAAKLQLEERFASVAAWQVIHHGLRFALIFPIVMTATGEILLETSAAYSLAAVIIVAIAIQQLRRMLRNDFEPLGHHGNRAGEDTEEAPGALRTLVHVWPYGADTLLYLAYFQCSNILLLYLAGDRDAGIYFAAFTIMNATYLLPTTLYTKFLLSKLHRWAHHDQTKLLRALKAGSASMLAAGTACGLAIWLASDFIINVLYGSRFQDAKPVLVTLAICAPIRFVSTSIGAILTTGSQMRMRVTIKALCAALCVALNVLLIPGHGATGAAVATLGTEIGLLLLFSIAIYVRRTAIFRSAHTQYAH
ncbi:oligosaccharide flippase family protein [Stenotrophomonas maltophilia]|uniref:Oligosaccharide flippase family protein n=1 Tax=Stenotrophomonas maltophilia TaxID=40324 RepID=A0AA89WL03_STEMA|nr:oligosaccharide flippase family protein [Stenotrophomonas maltophilia]MBH1651850.1 oligosaccharide flippase family protein [Stenotrophomonas maltophilia]HDS1509728.1 oligosaccharide flippase family protein [Stenotrophomonas maltophilia]